MIQNKRSDCDVTMKSKYKLLKKNRYMCTMNFGQVSVVTIWTLFSVVATVLMIYINVPENFDKYDSKVKDISSLVVLFIGYAAVMYMIYHLYIWRHIISLEDINRPVLKVQLSIVWILGLFLVSLVAIRTAIDIDCWKEGLKFQVAIAYRLAKCIYIFLLLAFLTIGRNADFEKLGKRKLSLYVIIITNLWLWMRSTFQDLVLQNHESNKIGENHTTFIESNITGDCFMTSKYQNLLKSVMGYLTPAELEFFILVTRFPIWTNQNTSNITEYTELQHNASEVDEERNMSSPFFSKLRIAFILYISTNSVSVIRDWITVTSSDQIYNEFVFVNLEEFASSINSMVTLVAVFYGFCLVKRHHGHSLKLIDFLYLLSMIGSVSYASFGVIAFLEGKSKFPSTALKSVLFLLSGFYQTVFLLLMKSDTVIITSRRNLSRVLTVICTFNVSFWILDVFVALRWSAQARVTEGHLDLLSHEV